MFAEPVQDQITPEEYLEIERASVDQPKCEFVEGIVYAMAGASISHNQIASNLGALLNRGLNERPCQSFTSDLKIHISETASFVYPDASAVCGPLEPYDQDKDVITNPHFIAEILSPSTEAYDRGKKFDHYKRIETLDEYLLIAQDRKHVDLFTRQKNGDWLLHSVSGDGETLQLAKLGIALPLDELYTNVEFPPPEKPVQA